MLTLLFWINASYMKNKKELIVNIVKILGFFQILLQTLRDKLSWPENSVTISIVNAIPYTVPRKEQIEQSNLFTIFKSKLWTGSIIISLLNITHNNVNHQWSNEYWLVYWIVNLFSPNTRTVVHTFSDVFFLFICPLPVEKLHSCLNDCNHSSHSNQ